MKGITCNNAIEAEGFRSALMEAGIESSIYDETNSKVARGVLAADFIWGEDLNAIPGLTALLTGYLADIQADGMRATVKSII